MAVATQQVTAYRGPRPVRVLPRAEVSPRAACWLAPFILATVDVVALGLAVLVVGVTSTLPLLYLPLALLSLAVCGAYRTRITLHALDAAPWLVGRLAVPLLVLAPAVWLGGDVTGTLKLALVGAAALVAGRVCSYAALRRARRHGALLEPTVILGAGEIGTELALAFRNDPQLGIDPVGFLDSVPDDDLPYPLLGDVDQLGAVLASLDVRRLIIAFGPAREIGAGRRAPHRHRA